MEKENDKLVRIQKYLSDKGIASRRKSEEWISLGLVSLNGEIVTELGVKFDPRKDKLSLDSSIRDTESYEYFLYHKPTGIVTVNAQAGETEIKDVIKLPHGVTPVGRLDKDTSGLIFLTNDGVAARRIMDPNFEHEKEYEVSFFSPFTEEAAKLIEKGIYIKGSKTKPAVVKKLGRYRVRIILTEGKNRQVRRLCEHAGYKVKKLKRVRVLNFMLDDLPKGRMRQLKKAEVNKLMSLLSIDKDRMWLSSRD
jgi:23S rRNA pseudouridine2605 synthase/23S rRNA pseudouridine2604 synthase